MEGQSSRRVASGAKGGVRGAKGGTSGAKCGTSGAKGGASGTKGGASAFVVSGMQQMVKQAAGKRGSTEQMVKQW